jgi:hypothetical protein
MEGEEDDPQVDDPGLGGTVILTKQDDLNTVQCVIIGESDIVTAEPQKLHLVPSGDGTYVVQSQGGVEGEEVVARTNVLAHFNESGNIAMLEYTDQS